MIQERHVKDKLAWPDGRRMAVTLTFDFQGGEDVKPDKNGKMNHEEWTQAEYGPRTGIWRILRILEETGVRATFLTCGGIAERYPEQVKEVVQNGHEIAGHGYHQEVARDLTLEQEREVIQDYRDDREAHWAAAGRMALLHPKPQQPATADGE